MVGEFTVLGTGADPRMRGYCPISSPATSRSAYEYVLQHPDQPSWVSVLLSEAILDFIVELVFGLLFEL
jgi:hypothetical protein